jgi:predicted esterase
VAARLRTAEGDPVSTDYFALRGDAGLTRLDWDVATDTLPPDGYRVEWRAARTGLEWDQGLSVLPHVDLDKLVGRVAALTRTLPEPDAATLLFEADALRNQLASLAPTRTAGAQRLELDRLLRDCRNIEEGRNPVAERRGVFRRAFRSRIDGTLQPFSVLIPDDSGDRIEWPLCVAFHGSGVDDVHYLNGSKNEFPKRVLVAAPFGRGASNWFTQGAAQQDVTEAVASMCEAYAVRRDRIFLCGFSMGAYGALRTYIQNPALYRAVAVFCTPPAARIEGETHPDFARPEFASAFAGTPVFVFHGRKDNSTPFVDAERMVAVLRDAGAHVTFCVEDDSGHSLPGATTMRAFFDWVDRVIRA